jgi:hypothetical protein
MTVDELIRDFKGIVADFAFAYANESDKGIERTVRLLRD